MSEESGGNPQPLGEDTGEAFTLRVDDEGGVRVLRVAGELDTISAPTLRSALLPALESVKLVVLDLSEVSFLGSSGLSVLVEALDHSKRRSSGLRLVCASRIVTRALEATGLRELFDITPDLSAALGR